MCGTFETKKKLQYFSNDVIYTDLILDFRQQRIPLCYVDSVGRLSCCLSFNKFLGDVSALIRNIKRNDLN